MNPTTESIVDRVRSAVRGQRTYKVGAAAEIEVKLNQNENPFGLPEELQSKLGDVVHSVALNRYPSEFPDKLVQALAERHNVDSESIIVGHGSNELSHFLALCFVEAGTKVVLPRPMFSLYESVVKLFGGNVIDIPCHPSFDFDMDTLIAEVARSKPSMVIIANPNNPTGKTVALTDLERLLSMTSAIVVIDEAYIEFVPELSMVSRLDDFPNLIVLRTLSKAFGLAGLRIGYMIGSPPLISEMKKARLPFMVGRHDEQCALILLDHESVVHNWVKEICDGTKWLFQQTSSVNGVETISTRTNFFLFKPPTDAAALADRLGSKKIAVRKMASYPELHDYLRVCCGKPDENQRFVDALKLAIDDAVA